MPKDKGPARFGLGSRQPMSFDDAMSQVLGIPKDQGIQKPKPATKTSKSRRPKK
jgi:hypothetical protein